jgi:histidine ammonia-lyase
MPRARGALAAYLRCNGGMTTTATSAPTVTVGTGPVSFDDVVAVARHDARVEISPESLAEVRRTRACLLYTNPSPRDKA